MMMMMNFWRFTDGFRRLLKISEDFQRVWTMSQRLLKIAKDFPIFDDFGQNRANDFQRISNQSRVLFIKSSEDVLTKSQTSKTNWIFI